MMKLSANIINFWRYHPALLYGVAFLLGFYCAFQQSWMLYIPIFLLLFPFFLSIKNELQNSKSLLLCIVSLLSAFSYGKMHYKFPDIPSDGLQGIAYVDIESLSEQSSYFSKNWIYKCKLREFIPTDSKISIAHNINCSIRLPNKSQLNRPLANQSYLIDGLLIKNEGGHYSFKPQKDRDWNSVKGSWSLAEWRFHLKQKIANFIKSSFSNHNSATFLGGLATGEFDDRMMQLEFARFSLQHIMAISGFHFAIIASILSFIFRLLVPRKIAAIMIVILLNTYFLFLGLSPSILRAWMMISIAMIGYCLNKQASALNSLGIALIGVLMVDPLMIETIGFQFSFLITGAILLYFTPIDYFLSKILLKRSLSNVVDMDTWNQHAYCILCFFRQGLALTLAVNIAAIPVMLYYFNQFPLMSLFYNFFFPFFVSFSMLLLLIGIFVSSLIPLFGQFIHEINNIYTQWILNLVYNLPRMSDYHYEIEGMPKDVVIIYLSFFFLTGILLKQLVAEKTLDRQDFAFI
ncbi:MAG: ComEC/Rec2 family competence protein [Parachlamydiaceae bacterium]|nr:ComEC/Rec2 family competence protein [Parachlamydiaceae bacterium]